MSTSVHLSSGYQVSGSIYYLASSKRQSIEITKMDPRTMDNLQELFDTMKGMSVCEMKLMMQIDEAQREHVAAVERDGHCEKIFDRYEEIANEWKLHYTHPKYAVGLKPVNAGHGLPKTVH